MLISRRLMVRFLVVSFAACSFFYGLLAQAAQPDGLYLMTRMWSGSSLETVGFFFKNGQVSKYPTGNLARFDFRAAAAQHPDSTGTYSMAGKKMNISWANGNQSSSDYEPSDHNCFYWDGGLFCPVDQFAPGTRIDGVFDGGASAGNGASINSHKLTLWKDGTYRLENIAVISTHAKELNDRDTAGAWGGEVGTYQLSGTTMTLRSSNGQTKQVVAFPYDDGTKGPFPRKLFYDAIMMKRISSAGTPIGNAAAPSAVTSTGNMSGGATTRAATAAAGGGAVNAGANGRGTWKTRTMTVEMNATDKKGNVGAFTYWTDGRGKYSEELNFFQHNPVAVIDSASHTQYTGTDEWQNGVAFKSAFDDVHGKSIVLTKADAQQHRATPIGTKVIQGHPSHGYRYLDGGNQNETWIADDIDAAVAGKITDREIGPVSYTLKSFSAKQTPGAFEFPPGTQFKNAY